MKPLFVTGNQHKADQLAKLLGLPLEHKKLELDEIQSLSVAEVAEHKVRQAYDLVKRPVFVEDVSLRFIAFGGLPGPFVKFFIQEGEGLEAMCRMLDGFTTREAFGECVYAYYDGTKLELMHGGIEGVIADHPRGENGFGWDAIFCPKGYGGRTRAELNESEYAEVYQIIKPIAALRAVLTK